MSQEQQQHKSTRVGIIGGGWPGVAHARGYRAAGGFQIVAVADLIPERRQQLVVESGGKARAYADAKELIADKEIDGVSVCLPTDLHVQIARAAMRAGKHVVVETPPGLSVREAKQLAAASAKYGKLLAYAFQRRFGVAELAARQAIEKGYAGEIYHARATWMRTRGVPIGTGWYVHRAKSGGGALIDIGSHMLDTAWNLLGQPRPVSVYAVTHRQLTEHDVEDAAFALVRFDGGQTLELGTSWAINQAPSQNGVTCRVYGKAGGIEVYTPQGAVLYRQFNAKGEAKASALKPPKVVGHAAMMRHFRECLLGKAQPAMGAVQGVVLMQMIEALYKSEETGRSVEIKAAAVESPDSIDAESAPALAVTVTS
ncbi:MAG TPA: Gfo/Idh/MocA family oxidoreductase [Tepidisphaeraceae bacterium]|nr:Gfo/Idh/MocA family oxidoreductase [Tepidisphaeraceae bacterium]